MTSPSTGHQSRIATKIQADYDTAGVVDELVPFTSEELTQSFVILEDDVLKGSAGRSAHDRGGKNIEGTVTADAVYDVIAGDPCGIEQLILASMGTGTRDAVNSTNQYTLKDILDTYLTIAVNNGNVSLFEYVGSKCNGMTISMSEDVLTSITFPFIAKQRFKTGDGSITNSIAGVNALSPAEATKVRWQGMTFRIGGIDDALQASDEINITSATLTFNRNMDSGHHSSPQNTGHTDPDLVSEPIEDDFREVTLELELSRYQDNTFTTWFNSDTKLQADFQFATGSFFFHLLLPTLKLTEVGQPVDTPGVITQTITASCFLRDSVNTFMKFSDGSTTVDEEFAIEIKSNRTAIPT
jgi:hypothetical protein